MIANCVHAAVIPYLDLVLLSTSVSYNIIFAILIGVMLGGEKFQAIYDLTSTALICSGSMCVVLLSNKEQKTHTYDELVALITSKTALFYIIFMAASIITSTYLYLKGHLLKTPMSKLFLV